MNSTSSTLLFIVLSNNERASWISFRGRRHTKKLHVASNKAR